MPNRRGSQRRRQERRENKRVERTLVTDTGALRAAIEDLRTALLDEDAGNGHVRDCAFEVVETYAAEDERTPTQATAQYLTRLLSNLDAHMAATCRHTDADDTGVVPAFKLTLLELDAQVARFVRSEDVQRHRRRLHGAVEQRV